MAPVVYVDTHVAAWLYAGRADLIAPRARAVLEDSPVLMSPMVILELEYLFEKFARVAREWRFSRRGADKIAPDLVACVSHH